MIIIKSAKEIELMRQAGRIVAQTLSYLSKVIRPGITTAQLDILAQRFIKSHQAKQLFWAIMVSCQYLHFSQ